MRENMLEQDITVYASDADTIQIPEGSDYTQGMHVGRTIPAKWWNGLFNRVTSALHATFANTQGVYPDVSNAISDAGIVPSELRDNQLTEAVKARALVQTDNYVQQDKRKAYISGYYATSYFNTARVTVDNGFTVDALYNVTKCIKGFICVARLYKENVAYPYILFSSNGIEWRAVYNLSSIFGTSETGMPLGDYRHYFVGIAETMANGNRIVISLCHRTSVNNTWSLNEMLIDSFNGFEWSVLDTAQSSGTGTATYVPMISSIWKGTGIYYFSAVRNRLFRLNTTDRTLTSSSFTATELGMGKFDESAVGGGNVTDTFIESIEIMRSDARHLVMGNAIFVTSSSAAPTIISSSLTKAFCHLKAVKLADGNIFVCVYRQRGEPGRTAAEYRYYAVWAIVTPDSILESSSSVFHTARVPGYFMNIESTSAFYKSCYASLNGTDYFELPFKTVEDYCSITYDNGYYYVISAGKIYRTQLLSASLADYEPVLDLNDSTACTISCLSPGIWVCGAERYGAYGTYLVSKYTVLNYGQKVYSFDDPGIGEGLPWRTYDQDIVLWKQGRTVNIWKYNSIGAGSEVSVHEQSLAYVNNYLHTVDRCVQKAK